MKALLQVVLVMVFLTLGILPAWADDFYSIDNIDVNLKAARDGTGAIIRVKNPSTGGMQNQFAPSVMVGVHTLYTMPSNGMIARAYFYDANKKIIATANITNAVHAANETAYGLPPVFTKDQPVNLYFAMPQNLPAVDWTALVVFGDNTRAVTKIYPAKSEDYVLDYREKGIVQGAFLTEPQLYFIQQIKVVNEPTADGVGVWLDGNGSTSSQSVRQFVPSLEVDVQTKNDCDGKNLFLHAYFYDKDHNWLKTISAPSNAVHIKDEPSYDIPSAFAKGQTVSEFIQLPSNLPEKDWTAIVVFGDEDRATVKGYPSDASNEGLDYPDHGLIKAPSVAALESTPTPDLFDKSAMDPINEITVKTDNPDHPTLTLFLRPPPGVTDGSKVKGVLAMCMIEKTPADVKRQLQGLRVTRETSDIIDFAARHQLAIIAWNMVTLWNPKLSYYEMNTTIQKQYDDTFDEIANAWEKGISQLSKQYNIPNNNYLLWGISGAAQYAGRLALRKPDHFLAVHVDIPSSFDKPTPDANKVLWLLTTGEQEGGYLSAKQFYEDCRSLGYPIIFKAEENLGHRTIPATQNLGRIFFEYALTLQDEKKAVFPESHDADESSAKQVVADPVPWPKTFRHPEFVGDIINQDCYAATYTQFISPACRVALPTKTLADAWNY